MKKILLFTLFFSSCTKEFVMNQCDVSNYYSSSKHSTESTFKNNQRQDVLSNHFYCNLCFENTSNRLISYSGKRIDFSSDLNLLEFMDAVLAEISQMDLGSNEYESFIGVDSNEF